MKELEDKRHQIFPKKVTSYPPVHQGFDEIINRLLSNQRWDITWKPSNLYIIYGTISENMQEKYCTVRLTYLISLSFHDLIYLDFSIFSPDTCNNLMEISCFSEVPHSHSTSHLIPHLCFRNCSSFARCKFNYTLASSQPW